MGTKIENNNQFVPVNTNPKEFKKVQKLMKEGRRLGGVHAGPESKVLDGLSWEEVKNMQDAQTSQVDGYGGMKVEFLHIFPRSSVLISQQPRVMVKESV